MLCSDFCNNATHICVRKQSEPKTPYVAYTILKWSFQNDMLH